MTTPDLVGITATKKLQGFADYLQVESHPATGPRTFGAVYNYRIPRDRLEEALRKGAQKE